VRQAGIVGQPRLDRILGDTQGTRDGDGGPGVLGIVRPLQGGPVTLVDRVRRDGDEIVGPPGKPPRDIGRRLVARADDRDMPGRLHREQPGLRRGIACEAVIAIEMIGRDVEQHGHVAIETGRQIDLIATAPAHRPRPGAAVPAPDRQADIAAHQVGTPAVFRM
jgi:hypothetical protein